MKTRISLCLLFFMILSTAIFADYIYLKNGTTLSGKVLRVTETAVEYDPDGDIPFDAVKRSDIEKIVYPDGKSVILPEPSAPVAPSAPAVSNNPQQQTSEQKKNPGEYTHDGFFFRPMAGYSVIYSSVESKYGTLKMAGSCYNLGIDLGYAVIENIIPFVEARITFGGAEIMNIADTSLADTNADTNVFIGSSALGGGLCVYLFDTNFHISGALFSYVATYNGELLKNSTKAGRAFSLSVGYEAWFSENWGVGFELHCFTGTADMDNDPKNLADNYGNVFQKTRYTDVGVSITCTYN